MKQMKLSDIIAVLQESKESLTPFAKHDGTVYERTASKSVAKIEELLDTIDDNKENTAQYAAWKLLLTKLGTTNNWDVGDQATYYAFFLHGWHGRVGEAAFQSEE